MKLEELLKDFPDTLKAVNAAIAKVNEGEPDKLKHVRFADLSEGGYVSKDKYTGMETDLAGKTAELEKATGLIEELKKSSGQDEGTQKKITEYETEIAKLKTENETLKTENALRFALAEAGAADVEYLMFKAKEKGEIKLGEDGKIKGEADLISWLKTKLPKMFQASGDPQGNNGNRKILENNLPGGDQNKTVTKDQFLKMGYAQRLKLKQENAELFKQLNTH